jgi:hypothetical protein
MCGIERQFREPRSLAHREVVVRYNTKEEIEATGEWLLRINEAETPEELLYVPSELSKMGVAPIDVVDRLDYLRELRQKKAANVTPEPVVEDAHGYVYAPEEPEAEEEPAPEELEAEEYVEMLQELPHTPVAEPAALVLDYDGYGAWEWAEPIEKMVEDAILAVFDLCPDVPDFNLLASEMRPKQPRAKGKRARSAPRSKELVSISAGETSE